MRQPARAAGLTTGRLERLDERRDRLRLLLAATALSDHPIEHPWHDDALFLQAFVLHVLRLQHRP